MYNYDVVVLIPVYNNLSGLKASIESINSKKYNIYILVIDDGSNQEELPKKQYFNKENLEIKFLKENIGVIGALNYGLKYINNNLRCKYMARLDAGDICINNRIDRQVDWLENNCAISFVGSWALVVNSDDKLLYSLTFPKEYNKISKLMYLNNCFVHPSLIIRWEFLLSNGFYSKNYIAAEDFELCFRMIQKGIGVNLPEFLLKKVYLEGSISVKSFKRQVFNRIRIIWNFRRMNIYFFYGLSRNMIIFLIPHKFIEKLKILF